MKTLIGLSIAVLLAAPAFAQTDISIAKGVDANCVTLYQDMQITVRGIIKVAGELGSSGPATIEDATGGIMFYEWPIADLVASGDDVTVTAWIDQYNGLIELVDEPGVGTPPTIVLNSTGNNVDATIVLPHVAMSETWEGSLVRCKNVFFHDADDSTMFNYTHVFEDAYGNLGVLYEDSSTDLGTMVIPGGWVDVRGAIGQYDGEGPSLCEGYQLIPRGVRDIIMQPSATKKASWSSVKALYR